jgi:glycosyltransferase involved in cell wall biosynthesis
MGIASLQSEYGQQMPANESAVRHKIVHLTSAHSASDVRIFHKECKSLAAAGYDVTLIAPHDCDTSSAGVTVRAVRPSTGRWNRMTRTVLAVYRAAIREHAEVYHFHDPELMPVGLLLKFRGAKVVFDVHEDYYSSIRDKLWINKYLRHAVAVAFRFVQAVHCAAFDRLVAATPAIAAQYKPAKTSLVQNFPWREELSSGGYTSRCERAPVALYAGLIDRRRCLEEMVQAAKIVNQTREAKVELAGPISKEDARFLAAPGQERCVEYLGTLGRAELAKRMARARMGLVLFYPIRNHVNAQPNKLFEYMSAGLPVVASAFPLWREIVEGHKCGLVVDPLSPPEIAQAMTWILDHPSEAEEMGRNGREAVANIYNWESEARGLLSTYQELLQSVGEQ